MPTSLLISNKLNYKYSVMKNPDVYKQMINYIIDYDEDVDEKKKIIKYKV